MRRTRALAVVVIGLLGIPHAAAAQQEREAEGAAPMPTCSGTSGTIDRAQPSIESDQGSWPYSS